LEEHESIQHLKYQYKTYQPEQCLCKVEFDTKYHRNNHISKSLKSDVKIDTSKLLLNAVCNENVINQIVCNLIKKDK